jgi:hypothetical protein
VPIPAFPFSAQLSIDGQYSLVRELDPSRDGLLFVPKTLFVGNQPGSQGFQGCVGKFHYNSIGMSLRLDREEGQQPQRGGMGPEQQQNAGGDQQQMVGGNDEMRFRRNRFQLPQRHRRDPASAATGGIVRLEATKGVVQGCSQASHPLPYQRNGL